MAGPPPKPKKGPDDLAEVERALSVLQGRHPEHERARREDEARRRQRAAELDATATAAHRAQRSARMKQLAIGVPVVALLLFLGFLGRRELARRTAVEQSTNPYRAMGFVVVDTSSAGKPGTLEATAEPGCLLAVSTGTAPITITRAGGAPGAPAAAPAEGKGPVLFCTCAAERITLSSPIDSGGLALMRTDAASLGGSRALPYAPVKPGTTLETDRACSEASFDAWLDAKRYPRSAPDDGWLSASPSRAPLVAAGFHVLAAAKKSEPFVVVDAPKQSCIVVTSSAAADRVGLRMKGNTVLVPPTAGAIARCIESEATLVVTREGAGEVTVLAAPAADLGGHSGVRDAARASGITLASLTIPAGDRSWDAKQLLVASQVPEAIIGTASTPDVPLEADARVVALSFETPGALVPELGDDVYSFCEPALDERSTHALCIFSGPQRWRPAGAEAVGGLARSKLPAWLFTMRGASDPVALKAMTQLLGLARRLGREGFSPTTLEALTELPNGVEVMGRAGEDAVVAVGVAPSPPWVFPFTDGAPWTLDDAPRVVPLKTLAKVTLTTTQKPLPAKETRRTVVFRRVVKK